MKYKYNKQLKKIQRRWELNIPVQIVNLMDAEHNSNLECIYDSETKELIIKIKGVN